MNKLIENYNEDSFRLTIRNVNVGSNGLMLPEKSVLD